MFDSLEHDLKELRELDLRALSAEEKDEAVVAWARLRNQIDAFDAALLGAWEAEKTWTTDGSRSPAAWLARRTRSHPSEVGKRLWLAKALLHMPVVAAAFAAGEIEDLHVRRIAGALNPRTREAFARDESLLVSWAQRKDFFRFCDRVGRWLLRNDPDGCSSSDMAQRDRRDAWLVESFEGMFLGKLTLDPISGQIVKDEHDRLEAQLFEADWSEARARLGREPALSDLRRSPAQRRADAFVEMARRSTRPAAGRAARPLFTVGLGPESFAWRCALSSGRNVSPAVLEDFLTEAELQAILFDPKTDIAIKASRKRFFDGILRRVIEVRDRFCACGCGMAAERCQADHKIAYAEGGMTCQCNGEARCAPSNRRKGDRRLPPLP